MTKQEAIAHFGSVKALAETLQITPGAISQWGRFPPPGQQALLQLLTGGALRVEPEVLSRKRSA